MFYIVYQAHCPDFQASYIDRTAQILCSRTEEHAIGDKDLHCYLPTLQFQQ